MKTFLDKSLAVALLAICSPVLLALLVVVRTRMGSPILFKQIRPGQYGRLFTLYKFRTMTTSLDRFGLLLADDERLTPFGRSLRRLSLDELPQLWNVIRGDMSLVGPRPLLTQYLERYNDRQRRRHEVRPGITGWAQVHGRNNLSWDQKLELDVWYVDHQSLWLDVKILGLTVLKVVRRSGIAQDGHATMPEFLGAGANEPETQVSENGIHE